MLALKKGIIFQVLLSGDDNALNKPEKFLTRRG
jgi:hypothetical protein